MKKLGPALAAIAACSPALAADIVDFPPPEPPVAFVPAFSWTGLYVGGQAGGSFNGGSSNAPSSLVFVPGIAATPGRPAVPAVPGTPGTPATPGTPGTPAVFGTLEYSCAGAVAGSAGAGACAVEYPDGTSAIVTREELSAAFAQTGNAGALGQAGVL